MLFTSILLATVATFAAAQTTTSSVTTTTASFASTPSCAAQDVLDACIGTEQAQINSCSADDWSCLCNNYNNLLTCYANCPNDPGVTSVQQFHTQYCAAASAYGTTTLMVASTTAATATTTGSGSTSTGATFGSGSASNTAASASASPTGNAAAHLAVDVLGFVAAAAVFFV